MEPGINMCERINCLNEAKADYQRKGVERHGWPENMPIALCAEHCEGHIPVICDLEIIDNGLIINIAPYPGYTLLQTKKPVVMFTKELKPVKEFASIQDASRGTGISINFIARVLRAERKSTNGYIFKYKAA